MWRSSCSKAAWTSSSASSVASVLDASHLQSIDISSVLFVLAILFAVRPLTIGLATLGAPMRRRDKLLMAWIAPRGIVAAATASIFGPAMVAAGYPEAEILMPLVFLVIVVTVIVHGVTLAPLARRLELAAEEENGLLIVGANDWTRALAEVLGELKIDVMIADGSWHRLRQVRMDGIRTYYGEVLSEHAEHELEDEHLSKYPPAKPVALNL